MEQSAAAALRFSAADGSEIRSGHTYIVVSRYELDDFTRGFAPGSVIDVWRDDQLTVFRLDRRN